MTTVAIVTRSDVKSMLGVSENDAELDAQIDTLIYSASEMIERAISKELSRAAATDYFSTASTSRVRLDLLGESEEGAISYADVQRFRLSRTPVDTGEDIAVYYDPTREFSALTAIDSSYWYLDEQTQCIVLGYPTVDSPRAIKVTYTGGYAVTNASGTVPANLSASAPDDLRLACIMQTMFMLDKIRTNSIGVVSQQENGQPFVSRSLLCPEVLQLVATYKPALTGRR